MLQDSAPLHQVLHGYRDGHRKLASSIDLSGESEQTMLVLSDLSGHGSISGFDEYITAYPIRDLGCYALAKTWYADEMPRPGCVWTHTILIPFATLAVAKSIVGITRLFVRPTIDSFARFSETLGAERFLQIDDDWAVQHYLDVSGLKSLLTRLYGSGDSPVLVPVASPREIEDVFFAIWEQQWPRLRRSFSFCTGAIAGRRIGNKWFDLQAVPAKRIDEIRRSIESRSDELGFVGDPTIWIELAIDDLAGGHNHWLRQFLFDFGAEATGGRRAFAQLATIFACLQSERELQNGMSLLVNALEEVFPELEQGMKLKQRLLDGSLAPALLGSSVGKLELLLLSKPTTFDIGNDHLREIARDAWDHERRELMFALSRQLRSKTKMNRRVLGAIAQQARPDFLVKLQPEDNSVVSALVTEQPMLLTQSAFQAYEGRNEKLIKYAQKIRTSKRDLTHIFELWLSERDVESISQAVSSNYERKLPLLLDVLAQPDSPVKVLSEQSLRHLVKESYEVALNWVRTRSQRIVAGSDSMTVVVLVLMATPYGKLPLDTEFASIWVALTDWLDEVDTGKKTRKAATIRLFSEAMQCREAHCAGLATKTFPYVYELPMRGDMTWSEWSDLRRVFGETDWFSDWDWCRTLREGLIDRFLEYKWPKECFFSMISDSRIGAEIRREKYYKPRHKEFLKYYEG